MKNRRTLLLCGLVSLLPAVAFPAIAQTATKLPRVVLILFRPEASGRAFAESFLDGMRQAGQVQGQTVQIDVLYVEAAGLRALINEIVAESPAVLVVGGLTATRYARDATTTVPIVVATSGDLLDAGMVQSLARPGGNITGVSDLGDATALKRLELLKAALPNASRVVVLVNPEFPATPKIEARVQAAAPTLGLNVTSLSAKDGATLEKALDSLEKYRPDVLVVTESAGRAVRCRTDQASNRAPHTRCPLLAWHRRARGTSELPSGPSRQFPARRGLCRQDPQRRETRRSFHLSANAL